MKKKIFISVLTGIVVAGTLLLSAQSGLSQITKGLIGKQDTSLYRADISDTFTRSSSDGYTLTLNKLDWVGVDVLQVYGAGVNANVATLQSAVTDSGVSNEMRFFIGGASGDWTIDSDLDLSSYTNIYWQIEPGARFNVSTGKTLTFYDTDHVIKQQNQDIDTGAGTVTYQYYRDVYLGEGAGAVSDGNNDNVGIGWDALLANTSGIRNISIGSGNLKANTTGNANIGIGYNNLPANLTGSNNISIGLSSQLASTAAIDNISIGVEALSGVTDGLRNLAIGTNSLKTNSSGDLNIALGYNSNRYGTGSSNIVVGSSSGGGTTFSGTQNVVVGTAAFDAATTANGCVSLGQGSLSDMTTTTRAIGVGFNAGSLESDGVTPLTEADYSVFIGYKVYGSVSGESNQIVIGREAVGIGDNSAVLGSRTYTEWTQLHGTLLKYQPGSTNQNTSATLTTTQMLNGILSSSAAGAINYTLPTGTVFQTDIPLTRMVTNDSFDLTIIQTGAGNVTILAGATGCTLVGNMVVNATSSGMFRIRKSGNNAYFVYRLN